MSEEKYVYLITKSQYLGSGVTTKTVEVRSTRTSAKVRLGVLEAEDECGMFDYNIERQPVLD